MIQRFKNFTATVKKYSDKYPKKEGQPDRALSLKIGDEFVEIGGGWLKQDKNGATFLSQKLSDAWVGTETGKAREGFCIVKESELNLLEEKVKEVMNKIIDPSDGRDLTPSADDIGF